MFPTPQPQQRIILIGALFPASQHSIEMNDSLLPKLRKTTLQVVRTANRPGGTLENGTFTMGIARREISQCMGLGEGGLDGKEWKGVVKGIVEEIMVCAICVGRADEVE
jgi:hypothetical protein